MATMREVRGLAWSIFWKYLLVSVVGSLFAGGVFGFSVGFVGAMAHIGDQPSRAVAAQIAGGAVGLIVSFLALNFFLASAIGRRYGERTLRFDVAGPNEA